MEKNLDPKSIPIAIILILNLKIFFFHSVNKEKCYTNLILFLRINGFDLNFDTDMVVRLCVKTSTNNLLFGDLKNQTSEFIENKIKTTLNCHQLIL